MLSRAALCIALMALLCAHSALGARLMLQQNSTATAPNLPAALGASMNAAASAFQQHVLGGELAQAAAALNRQWAPMVQDGTQQLLTAAQLFAAKYNPVTILRDWADALGLAAAAASPAPAPASTPDLAPMPAPATS